MPETYLVRQLLFHIRALRFLGPQWSTIDAILCHPMSVLWLLPLRFVRALSGSSRPAIVMDTRTVAMTLATRKDRVRALFYKLAHWLANQWADGQTAITWRMAQVVGIPSQQLWGIWPSGVDGDLFAPAQAARRWPTPQEPIRIIYVGVFYAERSLLPLCQAVERANAEGMAFVLSLVGDGPQRVDLEAFAQQTEGRVQVLPPVPHEKVPDVLAQAHLGALPFPDEEKFRVSSPIKLFEYMAAGLPIMATRIVCHTDVVGDKDYAFWAENATVDGLLAALRLVWSDRASLPQKARESAAAAQAWTWQESARKLKVALECGIGTCP
jgi:glycosyltransferase involved in cell wall biosynthesis